MKNYLLIILCLLSPAALIAQPVLKPSIGLSSLPADASPVCSIPTYNGSFYSSGYSVGDTINDFTLYTVSGTPVNMTTVLSANKPVLLIAGSYTCPVFRNRVAEINSMSSFYGSLLDIYVIYVVEAHPNVDPSPYSGTIWVTSQNTTDGVLYPQPTTYGQRKALVDTMLVSLPITAPVLVDGPCNEWWSNFGPAPNNAYLVDTNGIVKAKNGWYNRLPDNMWCSIDSLLGTTSGYCNSVSANGQFSFSLHGDSSVAGPAGSVLTVHGMVHNLSSSATVSVDLKKLTVNIPTGWQTSFCTDVCLPSSVDSTNITIAPADSQSLIFYFFTGPVPDSGKVLVGFKNVNNTSNNLKQGYRAYTFPTSLTTQNENSPGLRIAPNPAKDHVLLSVAQNSITSVTLFDLCGGEQKCETEYKGSEAHIFFPGLAPGIYLLKASGEGWSEVKKISVY